MGLDLSIDLVPGLIEGGAPLLLHDEFTDADSTSLDAHTPAPVSPGAWVEVLGDWSITGNQALGSAVVVGRSIVDIGRRASMVQARVQTNAVNQTCAIYTRYKIATTTGWMADIVQAGTNQVRLYEAAGGAGGDYTLRDSAAITITGGTYYLLEVRDDGNTITVWVDGVQYLSYTSTVYNTQTGVGMGTNVNQSRFDWIKAWG